MSRVKLEAEGGTAIFALHLFRSRVGAERETSSATRLRETPISVADTHAIYLLLVHRIVLTGVSLTVLFVREDPVLNEIV